MSFTAKITADITKFEQNIGKAIDSTNRLEKTVLAKLSKMGDSFVNVGKKASVLSAALVAAGGKAFMMAADFEDAIGATGQIFGENADIVKGWAETLGTEYGIAKKEAVEYSNLMGSMLINIGKLTEEQAARQSAKLIELAGDLTAMYGGRTQDAIRALTGALKGNNTMLDNYGMAVNDALVKTKAFEMGLSDGTGELSLQAKQAATLALIYEQTAAAQGQAAREADGASGAMRALTTEVKNLSTELGQVLIPVITPVVAGIRDMVAGLRTLSPEMQTLVVTTGAIAAAAGPLLIVIGKILTALPKIKVAIAALSGPIVAIGAAMVVAVANFGKNIEALKTDWDYLLNHLRTTSAGIGDVLTGNLSGWWSKVRTTWGKNIDYLRDKWEQFIAYFTGEKGTGQTQTGLEAALAAGGLEAALAANEIETLNEEIEETIIVTSELTEALDIFQSGNISEAIRATSNEIKVLGKYLTDLQTGKVVVSNVHDEIVRVEERLNTLNTALNTLTGDRELNIKVNTDSALDLFKSTDFGSEAGLVVPILPQIDTSLLKDGMRKLIDETKVLSLEIGNMVGGAIADMMNGIGSALGRGENIINAIGSSILSAMGSLAKQLGTQMIAFGTAGIALKKLMTNPYTAIAAGAALVALGAAASAAASRTISGATGGGYSSAPSLRNTEPSYGPSEYRGAYQDDFQVTFKIGTNELVGVLNTAEQRRKRL